MLSCCGRKSMKKLVAVIDMQNDFICGALSNSDTEKILPAVAEYVKRADEQGAEIVFTRDTHDENYAQTQEGRKLPVPIASKTQRVGKSPKLCRIMSKTYSTNTLSAVCCLRSTRLTINSTA